ncbi:PAS domain S-box [Acidovorax sp. CF316]|uniref:ATP-binding protein n=1 Tax=Acidovorax sp. CF316 TaxID=1144317 RepID=UPI00026BE52D|nr:ATP-binding protein [Acidovorax sp. CF316]EJE50981.1 PAS domain S-box [Acidovorax sp. CF316]
MTADAFEPSLGSEGDLTAENATLRLRLQELEETLHAIHTGDVDALVVNNAIYTLESAHAATDQLRQDVLGQMEDAVFAFDQDGLVMYVNTAAERLYGVQSSDVLGQPRQFIFTEMPGSGGEDAAVSAPGAPLATLGTVHRVNDGRLIDVEAVVSPLLGPLGRPLGSLAVVRDVTQRRRAEHWRNLLARLPERLREVGELPAIAAEGARLLGEALRVDRACYGSIDATGELCTIDQDWSGHGLATLAGTWRVKDLASFSDVLRRGDPLVVADTAADPARYPRGTLDTQGVGALLSVPLIEQGQLVAILLLHYGGTRQWTLEEVDFVHEFAERIRSVSERVRSANALALSEARLRDVNENLEAAVAARTGELMAVEEALRQSQKMEAVGQLTGGIAHDFNNLLGAVSASLQVLKVRMRQGKLDQAERYIAMGQDSVKRAAALTQRLLAFARRQTLDPKATDLNRLVAGLEELVRRSVGPDVQVECTAAEGLWTTRVDPSQLENSLLNLCINARDAMLPGGGRLAIATTNIAATDGMVRSQGLPVADYVCLSVTDTGSGMPAELIEQIFDPFFTTKPTGQGTGLGLSMVYGFVRQSGGHVRVQSEVGVGTTMRLYLPRHDGQVLEDAAESPADSVQQGDGETILVVEDESTIRTLTVEVLKDAGYVVVEAHDGPSALRTLASMRRVDLLLTDVGLPGGLNGRQVADAARQDRPQLKVLFITGFAQNAAVGNGLLDAGMEVMTKPFELTALARKVRDMMDGQTDRTRAAR